MLPFASQRDDLIGYLRRRPIRIETNDTGHLSQPLPLVPRETPGRLSDGVDRLLLGQRRELLEAQDLARRIGERLSPRGSRFPRSTALHHGPCAHLDPPIELLER